jgi:cell division protein FtsN
LAATKNADLTRFGNLSSLGQVYAVDAGGVYKVRLGVFSSRDQAAQALRNVKGRGYSDAFLVSEEGTTSTTTTAPPVTNPSTNPPFTNPSTTTRSGAYMVQLGAYSKPEYFDRAKAETMGTITSRQKSNLTLMLVSNIATLADARAIRTRARSDGWNGAFVVQDVNGTLVKVE